MKYYVQQPCKKMQDDLQNILYAITADKCAHNLQIVQVQLQKCNYFTNSAILFTKNARKIVVLEYK